MKDNHNTFIAHVRQKDKKQQFLHEHLNNVSMLASLFTSKLGLKYTGEVLGLLHDLGKYSSDFQNYLKSASGIINPDADGYVDSRFYKGRIDHSTAGAQWIWNEIGKNGDSGKFIGQILALAIASHHSGLINCLDADGSNTFLSRMQKADEHTNLSECITNSTNTILKKIRSEKINGLVNELLCFLQKVNNQKQNSDPIPTKIKHFYFGMTIRYLFSCLIDADRIDSADFETSDNKNIRNNKKPDWSIVIKRLERKIKQLSSDNPVDPIRQKISLLCKKRADSPPGAYSLTVPTGGGKTFSSLRFALHHAQKHGMDRIIYVIPYTSIIEQNATAIKNLIDCDNEDSWVLEIHSNLEPDQQTWKTKLISENWDAPIVLITMVQFLDVLFGTGTRGARKIHQLANSIIIFDEIQTLPVKCVHIFSNAVNFFTLFSNTTILLCTATQPLLNKLKEPKNGELLISRENELVNDVNRLFDDLRRVKIINRTKPGGWTTDEITELVIKEVRTKTNCLVIVNTKRWAEKLYRSCQKKITGFSIYHLSTNICPAHRKEIFKKIITKLNSDEPILCISTQLIEAGVDIDFSSVVRFVAGLDSIAQAAGRCNRNGKRETSTVQVINPDEENIDLLPDIREGRDVTHRIFSEFNNVDFTSPMIMEKYFQYYFYKRSNDMSYTISKKQYARDETILNLLSDNALNPGKTSTPPYLLKQSFMDAGKLFNSIDAPTKSLIVPYGEGKQIIAELCSESTLFDIKKYQWLIKKAQRYSINVFPNIWIRLLEENAIHETQNKQGIFYVEDAYYNDEFGLTTSSMKNMPFQGF